MNGWFWFGLGIVAGQILRYFLIVRPRRKHNRKA